MLVGAVQAAEVEDSLVVIQRKTAEELFQFFNPSLISGGCHPAFQRLISFVSPPFICSVTIVTKARLQDKCAIDGKNPQLPKQLGILD